MKIAFIGAGQAGGKVVDKFIEYERRTDSEFIAEAVAINTALADLEGLEYVDPDDRLLIGQSRVKGHGTGADNELGATIAQDEIDTIQGTLDRISATEVDAFVIVAALGGGTGSGGAPVIARQLKRLYTEPVYCLGILPAESEGGIYTLNAARSFRTVVEEVDHLLVFDNDAWREQGASLQEAYERINEEIAKRFGVIFSAGDSGSNDQVAESVVDASEIINTLKSDGISTVGYKSEQVGATGLSSVVGRLTGWRNGTAVGDESEIMEQLISNTRKATLSRLTLPCDVSSASRGLIVVAGRPSSLNRKGVEQSRRWLEERVETNEIRGGDYPIPGSNHLASVVLLSGITDAPRVESLQERAVDVQEVNEREQMSTAEEFDSLKNAAGDDLSRLI